MPNPTSSLILALPLTLILSASVSANPQAASAEADMAPAIIKANMEMAIRNAHTQWVELDSNRQNERWFFVIDKDPEGASDPIRILLRRDLSEAFPTTDYTSTVETLDLNCKDGEKTRLSFHAYDRAGQYHFIADEKDPKPERILHFYRSPLRLVCSDEYLLSLLPNGNQVFQHVKTIEAKKRSALIPDRILPVPERGQK
jgi:hypothetical protein